jgi:CDP-2,3-bis-(O-geranylgeranyl)-sn-glycerol synthase
MDLATWAAYLILFILPSYFANAIPVVLGGGPPLDGGRIFRDGQRLFGDGKTVRGLFAGILAGLLVGALEGVILPGTAYSLYPSASSYALAGLLLGAGTMAGDLLGSFVKRRSRIARGKPSILLDQLSFLAVALLFAYPLAPQLLSLWAVLFLAVLTYFVHVGANIVANRLGLKKVPW